MESKIKNENRTRIFRYVQLRLQYLREEYYPQRVQEISCHLQTHKRNPFNLRDLSQFYQELRTVFELRNYKNY